MERIAAPFTQSNTFLVLIRGESFQWGSIGGSRHKDVGDVFVIIREREGVYRRHSKDKEEKKKQVNSYTL